ncbi:zeta toxin family protein [Anianabacter salinae]|uniref:zeta toxin family protein n=1 Tax=Anianabacter salinae TaxID=2851023 RepID=UPI00225E22C2|nr:zeta toxin family protein [Anianabacter salinae]MBV0912326.1 zeta toxin family protein [Anianabacter salinae]
MEQPSFTVIAGPNGSGKSSLVDVLHLIGVDIPNYHNADDIARTLGGTAADAGQAAQSQVRNARDTAITDGISFTYETVMSHPSHVAAMTRARACGMFVRLIFITLDDPAINVARVQDRVAKGGHDVPADRVLSRWHRTMAQLPHAVIASDEAMIFDNSIVGANARPVAHVIGQFVRRYGATDLTWPEPMLFAPLRDADYQFEQD